MEITEKLALSVDEAAQLIGVSKPTMYNIIHTPNFPCFKVGTRTLISRTKLAEWVENQAEGRCAM